MDVDRIEAFYQGKDKYKYKYSDKDKDKDEYITKWTLAKSKIFVCQQVTSRANNQSQFWLL